MIQTVQTCDRCGTCRELKVGFRGQPADLASAAKNGGWRELSSGSLTATFCGDCVAQLVKSALRMSGKDTA